MFKKFKSLMKYSKYICLSKKEILLSQCFGNFNNLLNDASVCMSVTPNTFDVLMDYLNFMPSYLHGQNFGCVVENFQNAIMKLMYEAYH